MHKFMKAKVKAAGGSPKQVDVLRFGGERQVGGVRIAIVPVTHSNGIGSGFLNKDLGGLLDHDGLTAYAGPDNGYILNFSNGLVVYLSGDSGIFADQDVTVRRFMAQNWPLSTQVEFTPPGRKRQLTPSMN